MKMDFRLIVALIGLVATATTGALAQSSNYVQGQLIVKYKDGAFRTRTAMNNLYSNVGVTDVKRYKGTMVGFELLTLDQEVVMKDAVQELMRDPAVEYVQPNYILHAFPIAQDEPAPPSGGMPCIPGFEIPGCEDGGNPGNPGEGNPGGSIPCLFPGIPFPPGCEDGGSPGNPGNPTPAPGRPELAPPPAEVNPPVADPDLVKAYGIGKIGSVEAWEVNKGKKEFVVAVIDTGIDYNHEDLSFNVWRNPNPKNGDIAGFDFVHNDGIPYDDNKHGTHCAGTIGAVGGNGKGVSGVNQRVSIMALKFLSGEGSGSTADAIRAIDYAIENGAKVLSNSWGGKGDDGNRALKEAIDRAKNKDVLFIAAAGNDGTDNDGSNPSFPAAFDNDNMISVAATDKNDGLASFSNYGKRTTHLAAPGVNVYSTTPRNRYEQLSGTSMACPHVAGAAALLWSANPTWDYKKVKDVLLKSVDKLPVLAAKTVTGGRLNILNALRSRE